MNNLNEHKIRILKLALEYQLAKCKHPDFMRKILQTKIDQLPKEQKTLFDLDK